MANSPSSLLHQRDLGNFVAELADGEKTQSLHILVEFGGLTRPLLGTPSRCPTRFVMTDDPGYKWLETAVGDLLAPEAGSSGQTLALFDLRMLRFRGNSLSPEWERVVYGYDLFVLIPELTPGSPIE